MAIAESEKTHKTERKPHMVDKEQNPINVLQVTVSELAQGVRKTLEEQYGYVRVRGEISGYRGPHTSGHAYFTLKDEAARIDAVIWRPVFSRMRVRPINGLEVFATGRITSFPGKSSYQIIVEKLEPAGAGALMALLDSRRKQLADEGLFDLIRKRSLPFLPRIVGVVTSPSGSVIRDILNRLSNRFPVHVLVWPVRVQGEGAAEEISAAIRGLGALGETSAFSRPDVLIVARGGGTLEDLWTFNDEEVVRAVAGCPVPVISAVGHETDWTLIDYAADMRAPTPSAAAEMCVPVRSELVLRLGKTEARRRVAALRCAEQKLAQLRAAGRGLPSMRNLSVHLSQRKNSVVEKIRSYLRSTSNIKAIEVSNYAARLAKKLSIRAPCGNFRARGRN